MRECLTLFPGQEDFLPWFWSKASPESVKKKPKVLLTVETTFE